MGDPTLEPLGFLLAAREDQGVEARVPLPLRGDKRILGARMGGLGWVWWLWVWFEMQR